MKTLQVGQKVYYYIRKGEFDGELAQLVEDGDELTLQLLDGNTVKVPHHYCSQVPELGDMVTIEAPIEFKVIERLKANEPYVKIEAWVRVDEVSKI